MQEMADSQRFDQGNGAHMIDTRVLATTSDRQEEAFR